MPLLTREIKDGSYKPATASDNYLNAREIPRSPEKLRITILGEDGRPGYQVWAQGPEKKVALRFADKPTREDIDERCKEVGATNPDYDAKFFMCFPVWNYDRERVQVFQFTQSTLINPIVEALSDEEIEIEPWATDFNLSHNGKMGNEKRFIVTPVTGKRRNKDVKAAIDGEFKRLLDEGFDIKRFLIGDPFKAV